MIQYLIYNLVGQVVRVGLLGFLWVSTACGESGTWALVKVPNTDLSVNRLSFCKDAPYAYYNQFPYSPYKGLSACLRIHQLKFNELVKVVTCLKDEVECEVPHFFYKGSDNKEYKTFWVLKRDLVFLKDLPSKTVLSHIPPPYRRNSSVTHLNKNVLTLTNPWFDTITRRTYSAGTRFMRCPSRDAKDRYAIFVLAGDLCRSHVSFVPRLSALVEYPKRIEQTITLFVRILKQWAHARDGIIPYVFGGCSYSSRIEPGDFSLVSHTRLGEEIAYWQRKELQQRVLSGFDCSGMILCAAQICGIPYFYKNTVTIGKYMEKLKKGEMLSEGDFIWYSGHVMVVSDSKKNLLIEAVGYESGYGRVHEIPIDKVFKHIKTYKDLVAAYEKGTPLERLHSTGRSLKMIYDLKILSLKTFLRRR